MSKGSMLGAGTTGLIAAALLVAAAGAARADNVVAKRKGTTLVLKGDADGNAIRITDLGSGDHVGSLIVVTPKAATTINGVAAAAQFDDVVHLKISLGDGDDELEIQAQIDGNLKVAGGPGNDTVTVTDTSIGGNVQIAGSTGALNLTLSSVNLGNRSLVVRSGAESDVVTCDQLSVNLNTVFSLGAGDNSFTDTNGSYGDFFSATSGPGGDTFSFTGTRIGESARFALGAGVNDFSMRAALVGEDMAWKGGPGNDTVEILGTRIGSDAKFALSSGDNHITFDLYDDANPGSFTTRIGDGVAVLAGSGNDTVDFGGTSFVGGATRLSLASGNNTCNLLNSQFGDDRFVTNGLFVTAGSGNDTVDVTASTIVGTPKIKLGGGTNVQP